MRCLCHASGAQETIGLAKEVASMYTHAVTRAEYEAAANQLRWPFWDWQAPQRPFYALLPLQMCTRLVLPVCVHRLCHSSPISSLSVCILRAGWMRRARRACPALCWRPQSLCIPPPSTRLPRSRLRPRCGTLEAEPHAVAGRSHLEGRCILRLPPLALPLCQRAMLEAWGARARLCQTACRRSTMPWRAGQRSWRIRCTRTNSKPIRCGVVPCRPRMVASHRPTRPTTLSNWCASVGSSTIVPVATRCWLAGHTDDMHACVENGIDVKLACVLLSTSSSHSAVQHCIIHGVEA